MHALLGPRVRTSIVVGCIAALLAASCLPPGTPTISSSVDGVGTLAGVVTVRVTPGSFTPTTVTVRLDSSSGALLGTDASAPFTFTIDTTTIANGAHVFVASGTDGTKSATRSLPVTIDNRIAAWGPVDAIAQERVANIPLPGAGLLVAHHGAVVHDATFGTYTPDTIVPIASASKWLSAAAIMTLVEDGLVALDAPISQYLPEFTGEKAAITMRQLLSFTSGLRPDPECVGNPGFTLAACTNVIAAQPLVAPVGSQYRYGSGHLAVAGRIAEVVTGTSWVNLFSERIAVPTGLPRTFFGGGANPNPAGSGLSTLSDYSRFLRMLWNRGAIDGQRILSVLSVIEMEQDQTNGAPMVGAPQHRKDRGSRYGFGEWYDTLGPAPGAYEVNSPGAFGFHPWIDRTRDLYGVYVVLNQTDDGETNAGGWAVKTAVREAIDASIPTP